MSRKKVLISAVGAPNNGYKEVRWKDTAGNTVSESLPFMVTAAARQVDFILLLGTKQSFDKETPHYEQMMRSLELHGYDEARYSFLEIGSIVSAEEFWTTFDKIVNSEFLKSDMIELYVDLTFGYRIQPILIFLSAFFMNEMRENIELKGIYYGMFDADPPKIVDITELLELLQWIKAAQIFTQGGSAKILSEKIAQTVGKDFADAAENFQEFIDAYAFNYVSDLNKKAKIFRDIYNNKKFKKNIRNKFPVFSLIHTYINEFIKRFTNDNMVEMQLQAAKSNYYDGAYSRSILILREVYITVLMDAFGFSSNKQRMNLERVFVNRVFWYITESAAKPQLSNAEIAKAQNTYSFLCGVFGKDNMDLYFKEWGEIRKIRNAGGHIRNIEKTDRAGKALYKNKFEILKAELENHIEISGKLFESLRNTEIDKTARDEAEKILEEREDRRIFIIVNEGMHKILPQLKAQFGEMIKYEILTFGNTGLDDEKNVAEKCARIVAEHRNYKFYIIPSGFPYLALTAYVVIQQIMARHPVWLQYERENGRYIEKNLDPRYLLNDSFENSENR